MAYISKIDIPDFIDHFDYSTKEFGSISDEFIELIIKKMFLVEEGVPQRQRLKLAQDFDYSFLEKASNQGSSESDIFKKYISPVLKDMGKSTDPSDYVSFYEGDTEGKDKSISASDLKKIKEPTVSDFFDNFKGASFENFGSKEGYNSMSNSDFKSRVDKFKENVGGDDDSEIKRAIKILTNKRPGDTSNIDKPEGATKKGTLNTLGGIALQNIITPDGEIQEDDELVFTFPILGIPEGEGVLDYTDDFGWLFNDEGEWLLNSFDDKSILKYIPNHSDYKDVLKTIYDVIKTQEKLSKTYNKSDNKFSYGVLYTDEPKHITTGQGSVNNIIDKKNIFDFTRFSNTNYDVDDGDGRNRNYITPGTDKEEYNISGILDYFKRLVDPLSDFVVKDTEDGLDDDSIFVSLDPNLVIQKLKLEKNSSGNDTESLDILVDKLDSNTKYDSNTVRKILQKAINKNISGKEQMERSYIGPYISKALENGGNSEVLKKYFGVDDNYNLVLKNNTVTDEHLVPMQELYEILREFWNEGKQENVPKEELTNDTLSIIKGLYGRVFLDSIADDEITKSGMRDSSKGLISKYKNIIKKGDWDNFNRFERYEQSGILKNLSSFNDVFKSPNTPLDLKNATADKFQPKSEITVDYEDDESAIEESKKPLLTNLLFGYYG